MANAGDDVLAIPGLPLKIRDAKRALRGIKKDDGTLGTFMELVNAGREIRLILDTNQKRALVTYSQTIPDVLEDIAVLDAAYRFRSLMTYDSTIKDAQ